MALARIAPAAIAASWERGEGSRLRACADIELRVPDHGIETSALFRGGGPGGQPLEGGCPARHSAAAARTTGAVAGGGARSPAVRSRRQAHHVECQRQGLPAVRAAPP